MTQHQLAASTPTVNAWVSASAGTGKTTVLVNRFLRTLLFGVAPEKILCLTFTNAAAAEMEERLKRTLASWCTMADDDLSTALFKLTGEPPSDDSKQRARHLFARILDARGGLKTMTIHSFCQMILYRFPVEAGISPSFDVIDELTAKDLKRQCQEEVFSDPAFLSDIDFISRYLRSDEAISDLLSDMLLKKEAFEKASPHVIGDAPKHIPVIDTPEARQLLAGDMPFEDYKYLFIKKTDGQIRAKADPHEAENVMTTVNALKQYDMMRLSNAILSVGKAVFERYARSKKLAGAMDFDDLIDKTLDLLQRPDVNSWVMYKLDDTIDHIFVDEAQDTSHKQWQIIRLLTEEFFSGAGKKGDTLRTLFVVGDEKQSIYSFQGADLQAFFDSKTFFKRRISDADLVFKEVPLSMSFRSAPPILDLVNRWIDQKFLDGTHAPHEPSRKEDAGLAELWPLETEPEKPKDDSLDPIERFKIEQSMPSAAEVLTKKIVFAIDDMIKGKEILKSKNRPIRAGDILILFEKRRNNPMIDGIIRGLKEKDIPVSGIDRLILTEHIAILDLIALSKALLNKQDDYSLACALKSPVFGLTEDDLFVLSARRSGTLFDEILKNKTFDATAKKLLAFLADANLLPPYEFFHTILFDFGIKKDFIRRMGNEVSEAIDEFLSLCLAFEQTHLPSLELFIEWLDNEDIEIKRETENKTFNAVRLMTIHGAKGLQAPIVFLIDTRRQEKKSSPLLFDAHGCLHYAARKEHRYRTFETLKQREDLKNEQETNRLFYVALTRAEDRLYIAGHAKDHALSGGWYDQIQKTFKTVSGQKEIYALSSEQIKTVLPPAPKTDLGKTAPPPFIDAPLAAEKPFDVRTASGFDGPPPLDTEALRLAKEKGIRFHADMEKTVRPGERAEVPIAGLIDGVFYTGRIDRLIEKKDEIVLIDYKTGKRKKNIPPGYLAQMDIYRKLVQPLYPDKKITCQILWTEENVSDTI